MEECRPDTYYPFDLSGVTMLSADGDGSIPEFGDFFKAMQIQTFAFYDAKLRKPEEERRLVASFDIRRQTNFAGMEKLLVTEIPVRRLWQFMIELRDSGEEELTLPNTMPAEKSVREQAYSVLKNNKGAGYGGRVIALCEFDELPSTVTTFLSEIYARFPRPPAIPPIDDPAENEKTAEASAV